MIDSITKAVSLLKNGQLVAIPTETVYGLAADAKNPEAIQKIYNAKGRPFHNPLIVHLPHTDLLSDFAVDIPDTAFLLAKAFWPGPLTLVLKKHPSVPEAVTGGQDSIAIRIPNHPLTLALLETFKGGIAAPSANRYGHISPTTPEHVRISLGDRVDFILEGGTCAVGIESTIVSLLGDKPVILRKGSITESDLAAVLKEPVLTETKSFVPNVIVPGNDTLHYAPVTPLYLYDGEKDLIQKIAALKPNQQYCVLNFSLDKENAIKQYGLEKNSIADWTTVSKNPVLYAQKLYAYLYECDQKNTTAIFIEKPDNAENWAGVNDRLARAAHNAPQV